MVLTAMVWKTRIKLISLTLAACACGSAGGAEEAPPRPSLLAPSAAAPAPKTAPAQRETPRRGRAISPEVAAQLAASAPKYTPAPPKPEPKPEDQMVDMRDVDKPRNGIIRLPKYIVQEPQPPMLTERAVNTKKGLGDIAMRRYISETDRALNRFTLPLFGSSLQNRALAMYAEDERLKNMAELNENARAAAKSDPAQGTYILRETQKTYMRTSDFGWQGGAPK
jgi:hypothetical protein